MSDDDCYRCGHPYLDHHYKPCVGDGGDCGCKAYLKTGHLKEALQICSVCGHTKANHFTGRYSGGGCTGCAWRSEFR